jgi:hypothetical protein
MSEYFLPFGRDFKEDECDCLLEELGVQNDIEIGIWVGGNKSGETEVAVFLNGGACHVASTAIAPLLEANCGRVWSDLADENASLGKLRYVIDRLIANNDAVLAREPEAK